MNTFLPSRRSDQWLQEQRPLVEKIARKIASRLPPNVEVDDLIQEGLLAVWSQGRLRSFPSVSPHLVARIRGAMLDALRRQDWSSRGGRQRSRKIQRSREHLCQSLGREPSLAELAAWNNMSVTQVRKIKAESTRATLLSWEELHELEGPTAAAPDSPRPAQMDDLLNQLPPRERAIIVLHYFEDRKLGDIAQALEISQPRLSQLHHQAIRRLQQELSAPPTQTTEGKLPFARPAFMKEARPAAQRSAFLRPGPMKALK